MKSFFQKPAMAIMGSALILQALPMTLFAAVADITPPAVSISAPINGTTVSGTVSLTAAATDVSIPATDCVVTLFGIQYDVTSLQTTHSGGNIFTCGTNMTATYQAKHGTDVSRMAPYTIPTAGISKVDYYVDGVLKGSATASPFTFSWDTTTSPNGSRVLIAKAYDLAGNHSNSPTVTVTVNNTVTTTGDTTAPVAAITSPLSSATVSGTTTIAATATDNVAVTKVEFYVDSVLKSTSTVAPYTATWDTTTASNGTHSLLVKAYDAAGNVGSSAVTSVTVNNTVVVVPPPANNHHDDDGDDEDEYEEHDEHNGYEYHEHRSENMHSSHVHWTRNGTEYESEHEEKD